MWTSRRWSVFPLKRSPWSEPRDAGTAQHDSVGYPRGDIIVFFDDDFFADRDYLANVERIFTASATSLPQPGFCWRMDHGPG